MNEFWGLFWGTLISEDISCITGGILAKQGKISLLNSILACTFGIYFGDILLFLSGKFFSGILKKWSRFNYIFESGYYSKTIKSLENNFIKIIFLSRFMPGTRLPV
ncbi:MAG: SNARE-like domain protein, partial [Leptospiraceae bacterium]|nr:SNARE-like domain protein [Leptospiraceae bacterium]